MTDFERALIAKMDEHNMIVALGFTGLLVVLVAMIVLMSSW